MTSRRAQLQEDTYFRVLRMLQADPDVTQREIAERLGVSTSGLNYCLNALIDKGWVKVQNLSQSKNKFGYIYVLTPQGMVEKAMLTTRFLKRKMAEYEAMKLEIDTLTSEISSTATPPIAKKSMTHSAAAIQVPAVIFLALKCLKLSGLAVLKTSFERIPS
jgi:EPS-associated MarR family transcriptional regulator